jgi:flagellar basal body rod protein FlgG
MGTGIRPTGVDNAAAALRYWERREEVVANNLANVSTGGFKGERAFARLLGDGSTPAIDTATDLRTGPITTTGAPFDIAIAADGFFVVATPDGEKLTRGGATRVDEHRQLVDQSGNALLGEDDPGGGTHGPVVLPEAFGTLQITEGGAVIVDGNQVARLRLERVPAGTRLQHEANGLFGPPVARETIPYADRTVRQGAREESNVNSVEALVDMIAVQRAYGSVQKVLTTIDSARGIAINELGRPA